MIKPPEPPHAAPADVQLQWLKLTKYLRDISLAGGFSNVVYVDINNGNDVTGSRGDFFKPFASIQAGVNAAQNGDVVWVGPGRYEENLTIPPTRSLAIVGFDKTTTVLTNLGAGTGTLPVITWGSAAEFAPCDYLVLANLTVIADDAIGNAYPVVFNGENAIGHAAFTNGALTLRDVQVFRDGAGLIDTQTMFFQVLNRIDMVRVDCGANDAGSTYATWIGRCSYARITDCTFDTLTFSYTDSAHPPANGRLSHVVNGTTFWKQLMLLGISEVTCGPETFVFGEITQDTEDDTIGVTNYSGRLVFEGDAEDVEITHASSVNIQNPVASFLGARISGSFHAQADVGSASRIEVRALGCTLYRNDPGNILADTLVDLDVRGSFYPNQGCLSATGGADAGTIDRTTWMDTVDSDDGALTFAIPYPAAVTGATAYSVALEYDTLGDAPGAVSLKLPTGFTLTSTATVGDVVYTVTRPYTM